MSRFITVTKTEQAPRARLECCVCGADAGRWLQHSNRDTGFGLCHKCRDWQLDVAGEAPERMAELYGLPGRNYEGKTHLVAGRLFVVVAEFPEAEADRANAFMEKHKGASVLEVLAGRVVLAWQQDGGVEAPAREGAAA